MKKFKTPNSHNYTVEMRVKCCESRKIKFNLLRL